MKHKNANTVISGETFPPVTVSIDSIKALKPTGRVVVVEDCPEIKPKLPPNNTIRAGSQK